MSKGAKKRQKFETRILICKRGPFTIPVKVCWSADHPSDDYTHYHSITCSDTTSKIYRLIKTLPEETRYCKQCVDEYNEQQSRKTADSTNYYQVVRLNHNQLVPQLPFEMTMEIYRHLLLPQQHCIDFKRCKSLYL